MDRHRTSFRYGGPEDDQALELAFSKNCVEERKAWITAWMERRRRLRAQGRAEEESLYDDAPRNVTFHDFVNKELIVFSNADNRRNIPSLVDGLKPGQRKVSPQTRPIPLPDPVHLLQTRRQEGAEGVAVVRLSHGAGRLPPRRRKPPPTRPKHAARSRRP